MQKCAKANSTPTACKCQREISLDTRDAQGSMLEKRNINMQPRFCAKRVYHYAPRGMSMDAITRHCAKRAVPPSRSEAHAARSVASIVAGRIKGKRSGASYIEKSKEWGENPKQKAKQCLKHPPNQRPAGKVEPLEGLQPALGEGARAVGEARPVSEEGAEVRVIFRALSGVETYDEADADEAVGHMVLPPATVGVCGERPAESVEYFICED
ncbi:hypothetical protein K438DRAFT_1773194 [Mycena galopus ATCC 62051]|nr:hypothetical protein K438DRAFT_1773194 [Mycena galopus ATCC 62051]